MVLNIHSSPEAFGEIVEATYGEGYKDYKAALMNWATYEFLTQLSITKEPITSMSYRVLYAKSGREDLVGDKIPREVLELPERLPVAVKSCKINVKELARLLGKEYLADIWHNAEMIPALAQLGLLRTELGVGVAINIPYHAVPNGETGRNLAYFFEY